MTTTRFLTGALVAAATAATGFAQSGIDPSAPGGYPLIPSVRPVEMDAGMPRAEALGLPPGRPAAAAYSAPRPYNSTRSTALERVTAPVRQASGQEPDPVGTLTGQPALPAGAPLPPGAYPSPFMTDGPGCCGPLGRNGRVGYELYTYTGPTWAIGEGEFTRRLQTGWMVGGGGRSLFFDVDHTAAWVLDLGVSYQYNRGEYDDPIRADVKQPPIQNPITNEAIPRPDVLTEVRVRALNRTNFNYGIGRDWWLWGPGSTGLEQGKNLRVGGLVGGRWGTAHVELEPVDDPGGYARRQNVTYGIYLATHTTCEIPMGTWILFGGIRAEWGYDFTNLVPPMNGNMHNFNLLLTSGIRY